MQPLKDRVRPTLGRRLRSGRGGPPKTAAQERRSDIRWGIAGVSGVLVLAAAFGVVYLADFGVTTYRAELPDAGAVRSGDDVRVAGITVGTVESVTLAPDHVDMTFTVDSDVFVGDRTTLDVRMLTIVGGHYLAVFPAGDQPLGDTPIPPDRVVLPYSLPQVFQDAIDPVTEFDGNLLRDNLGALEASLDRQPHSIAAVLTAGSRLVDVLERQNADISRTLSVADEYMTMVDGNLAVVGRLIRSLGLLETLLEDNIWAVGSLDNTAIVVDGIAGIAAEWPTLKPMAEALSGSIGPADELAQKLGALLDSVKGLLAVLQPLVGSDGPIAVDHSALTVASPGLCIPVPGRVC